MTTCSRLPTRLSTDNGLARPNQINEMTGDKSTNDEADEHDEHDDEDED